MPVRAQVCNGARDYAAQIPEVVYWYDAAEKKGIENTFMRLVKKKSDSYKGAVVFDFSYKKLMPEEGNKYKIRVEEQAEPKSLLRKKLDGLINFANDLEPDFEGVKTLGDIQDYIVEISVDYGSHPSNPWMNEAIGNGFLGGREMPWTEMSKNLGLMQEKNPEVWEKMMKTGGKKSDGTTTKNISQSLKHQNFKKSMEFLGLLQKKDPESRKTWKQTMKIAEKKKSDGENGVFMKKAEECDDLKKGRGSAEGAVEKSEADEKKQRLKQILLILILLILILILCYYL